MVSKMEASNRGSTVDSRSASLEVLLDSINSRHLEVVEHSYYVL